MTFIQTIILAIVEGITEFLPISSTAHMKFTNPLIGVATSPFVDMFEVVIQLAAILSVVVIFWKKFIDFKHPRFYIKLLIGFIPAMIVGLLLKKYIDKMMDSLLPIAIIMLVGGIILLFIDNLFTTNTINEEENILLSKSIYHWLFSNTLNHLPRPQPQRSHHHRRHEPETHPLPRRRVFLLSRRPHHVCRLSKKLLGCVQRPP